jgi:hypothetical protein
MPQKYLRLDPDEWDAAGVPEIMQRAARTLNEALDIDRETVTAILDGSRSLREEVARTFEAHPSIVVRKETDGRPALSMLGLLAGLVNEPPFFLVAEFSLNDDGSQGSILRVTIARARPIGDA